MTTIIHGADASHAARHAPGGPDPIDLSGVTAGIAKWAPYTTYPTPGVQIISPNNDVVSVVVAHTSTSTYDATKFGLSGTYAPKTGATFTGDLLAKSGRPSFDLVAFGGDPTGAADSTAAWNAMMAALPSVRGAVVTAVGAFTFTGVTDAVPVAIKLTGAASATAHTRAGTRFYFPTPGTRGLLFSGNAAMSEVEDLYLLGGATALGTDDGISTSGRIHCTRVTVDGFGRDGFALGIGASNCNNSTFSACRSWNNKRHGYIRQGTDSNVVSYESACSAQFNGGYGFYSDGAGASNGTYLNIHCDSNTLGPIYDNGWNNQYVSVYDEHATVAVLDTAARNSVWILGAMAAVPTVSNLSGDGTNGHYILRGGVLTGGLVVGTAVLANAATDGFLYAPAVAGTPTGVPTAKTGTVPIQVDTTAGKLWAYVGGAWKGVVMV